MEIIVLITLLASAGLQIFLIYKVWVMTKDVKRIVYKIDDQSALQKASVCYLKGQMDEANIFLTEAFFNETSALAASTDDYYTWESGFEKLKAKYSKAFEKIGYPAPNYEEYKSPKKYLLY